MIPEISCRTPVPTSLHSRISVFGAGSGPSWGVISMWASSQGICYHSRCFVMLLFLDFMGIQNFGWHTVAPHARVVGCWVSCGPCLWQGSVTPSLRGCFSSLKGFSSSGLGQSGLTNRLVKWVDQPMLGQHQELGLFEPLVWYCPSPCHIGLHRKCIALSKGRKYLLKDGKPVPKIADNNLFEHGSLFEYW